MYLLDPDLHRPLFGKITIGFIINNVIAYLCLSGNYLNINMFPNGSYGCVTIGYLTQYTFISFMFWINAMAVNIFFKFTSMRSSSSEHQNNNRNLFLYLLYSQVEFKWLYWYCVGHYSFNLTCQGMPLLLCITTAMMDYLGPCEWSLPHMGAYHCFLGSSESNQGWSSFFSAPEFLYFNSIILVLQTANIIFFLLTVYYFVDHWKTNESIVRDKTKRKFQIVLKLFFIMGRPNHHNLFSVSYRFKESPGLESSYLT